MTRHAYRTSIPAEAVEVVEERYPDGGRKSASYFRAGEKVGHRDCDEDGCLDFEYALRNGVKHGREYRFYPNGQPVDEDPYRDGRLHGVCRQWAEDGTLLVTSRTSSPICGGRGRIALGAGQWIAFSEKGECHARLPGGPSVW